jgi:hypothetical protein
MRPLYFFGWACHFLLQETQEKAHAKNENSAMFKWLRFLNGNVQTFRLIRKYSQLGYCYFPIWNIYWVQLKRRLFQFHGPIVDIKNQNPQKEGERERE